MNTVTKIATIAATLLALTACLAENVTTTPAPAQPEQLVQGSTVHSLKPQPEQLDIAGESEWCQRFTWSNPTTTYVAAASITADIGVHHSIVFAVNPDNPGTPTDERFVCKQTDIVLDFGVEDPLLPIFASSTQIDSERLKFPDGAAVAIPPGYDILVNTHYLNTSGEPATIRSEFQLETIDPSRVTTELRTMTFAYLDLSIPPNARTEVTGECPIPPDLELYDLLSHQHATAAGFWLEVFDDDGNSQRIYQNQGEYSEGVLEVFPEPIDLSPWTGLRFNCAFDNPWDETLVWGIGRNEMCMFYGHIASRANYKHVAGSIILQGQPCYSYVIAENGRLGPPRPATGARLP